MDYATERVNHTAGQVVKAFLDHGKNKMKSLHEDDSRKLLLLFFFIQIHYCHFLTHSLYIYTSFSLGIPNSYCKHDAIGNTYTG